MKRRLLVSSGLSLGTLLIVVGIVFISLDSGPKPPIVTAWLPSEIVGQGTLVDIGSSSIGQYTNWLIFLEKENTNLEVVTLVYHILVADLRVSPQSHGQYQDVKEFRLGSYYVLYRKVVDGHPIYLLQEN